MVACIFTCFSNNTEIIGKHALVTRACLWIPPYIRPFDKSCAISLASNFLDVVFNWLLRILLPVSKSIMSININHTFLILDIHLVALWFVIVLLIERHVVSQLSYFPNSLNASSSIRCKIKRICLVEKINNNWRRCKKIGDKFGKHAKLF